MATTPAFLGANPAEVPSGPRKGLRVLAVEEDLGRAPTHLIEYDNRGGDHIHTVFRDLQDDFGESLLARHLQEGHGAPAGRLP